MHPVIAYGRSLMEQFPSPQLLFEWYLLKRTIPSATSEFLACSASVPEVIKI